jgi:hypothetical protein
MGINVKIEIVESLKMFLLYLLLLFDLGELRIACASGEDHDQ